MLSRQRCSSGPASRQARMRVSLMAAIYFIFGRHHIEIPRMTRWSDRRDHLRKRAISALYPLSRYWPVGAYEQPELWVSDALKVCYVVNPKVACSSIQVALTEAATGAAVQGFRHNHPDVLAF